MKSARKDCARYIYKVVVVNVLNEDSPKIRHVVSVRAFTTVERVKRWYYVKYRQREGDKFIVCSNEADIYSVRKEYGNEIIK